MKKLILLICLLLHPFYSFSSSGNLDLLTMKNGLNNNTVNDVYYGKSGFLWLSTDVGISRYDGFRFRNFPLISPASPLLQSSLCSVRQMMEGAGERLYLLLSRGGIACFDRQQERYLPLLFDQPLDEKSILSFYVTNQDVLYIGTTEGLYMGKMVLRKEKEGEKMVCYLSHTPLVKGKILKLCGDEQGNLFAGINAEKVFHYNTSIQKGEYIGPKAENAAHVTALYVHGDYLWICYARSEIICYHLKQKRWHTLTHSNGANTELLAGINVTDIECVNEQTYFLSTWAGLFRLTFGSEVLESASYTMECITRKESNYHSGSVDEMTSVLWDASQQIVWAGTFGGGVLKVNLSEDYYSRVEQNIDARVSGVEEDSNGYVWLATNKGVWRSTTKSLSNTTLFVPWTKGVSSSESYQMYKDRNGNLWLGDMRGGVIFINIVTEETQSYLINPGGKGVPINIRHFCLDARNHLWITTSDGLMLLDYKVSAQCRPVPILNPDVKEVYAIADDKEGNIWVGTDVGLKRLEMQGEKANLIGDYERQAKQAVEPTYSIYVNSYNQIFASYSDKVIRIDGRKKEKVETIFSLRNGLESGHVYCMVDDQNGNTWIGSNSDIMTIRNDRSTLYNYSLSGNYNKVCRLKDGRLLWSSSWGLFFFDPLMVKSELLKKQLMLSELSVNGEPLSVGEKVNGQLLLTSAPYLQRQFVFNADNSDLCFYFTDLQCSSLQRTIAYRLLPNEEEWKMAALEEGIDYRRLSAGNYTLQVKLVYLDASEGEVLEVPICVKAYWWQTIWAYLGYLSVLAILGYLISFLFKRREKSRDAQRLRETELKEKLNLDKMEQGKRQEIESVRNQLLTIVVQELRTPLSLIIAPLKEMSQEVSLAPQLLSKVQVAYRNAVGMLDSCNQLSDIYTQGLSTDRLEVTPYDADRLVDSVVFTVSELIRVHQIDFQYEKKVRKGVEVWIDKKRIDFVLHNLLSNALNYIHFSGSLTLLVQEQAIEGKNYCTISVTNKGKSTLKVLTQTQDDDEQIGLLKRELGFDVMQRIVLRHHGKISVVNEEGGGTEAILQLPIGKEAFENDSQVNFIPLEEKEDRLLEADMEQSAIFLPEETRPIIEAEETSQVPKGKKTLLIVEDHKDIRLYLKVLLGKDYAVLFAVNGQEGLEMATKEQPDLIICDVMMPVMDGFECCRNIKENLETCHIPMIMLTAKVEDEDIIKGLEMGADDYMLKPFAPGILKAKIKNLINGRVNLKQMYTKLLMLPGIANANEVSEDSQKVEDPFITSVVEIIEENICKADFNVKKLASDMNMSQPTLYRKVKQSTDFTIIELIRGVRMKKAAILLKQKQHAVQEVAEMVGYNDIPTFRKHFVDTYGTTPSTYADSEA